MNNIRRKQIKEAKFNIDKAMDLIQDILNEEDTAFNNLSEGLQCTMRGAQMENNIDELQEIIDYLEEINNCLKNID